jgi:starch phosphorylase
MGEIMKNKTPINASMDSSRSKEIDGFDSLRQLALDLHWSWNHCTDQIWRQLDPVLWELTHNPWVVLQTVAREKLVGLLGDPTFRGQVDALLQSKKNKLRLPHGFNKIILIAFNMRCVFQYGIHVKRGSPNLFGWTWQCGWRST